MLSGIEIHSREDAFRAGRWFLDVGVREAIITLGENGTAYVTREHEVFIPTQKVNAVDTTAAGDSFNGGFAVGLARGESLENAIRLANAVGALSTTAAGAQAAMPTMAAAEKLMQGK